MGEEQPSTTSTDEGAGTGTTQTQDTFKAPESQEALQAIIDKAVGRVHRQYKGHDDFKTKAAQFDAQQGEQQDVVETLTKERDGLTAKLEARNQRIIVAEANAKAVELKSTLSGEHLLALASKDGVTVGDDGQVTGIEESFKAFLDANPQYVGTATPPPRIQRFGTNDGGASGAVKADIRTQIAEAEAAGDRSKARRLKTQLLTQS